MKKTLFFLIDGLADLPINGKTPLSEAKIDNMNFFAKNGRVGNLTILSKKEWENISRISNASISHFANISLLGYDPKKFVELKRGPLEAVGAGIEYREGELAIRCNFASVDKKMNLIDRRAGRNSFGLDEIVEHVNKKIKLKINFTFKRTFEHRAVLILHEKLSSKVTTNDPFKIGEKVKEIKGLTALGKKSAKILQDFVNQFYKIANKCEANKKRIKKGLLPANYLLLREAGNKLLDLLPHFTEKWKIKAICIAENGVVKATCLLAGFDALTIPEMNFKKTLNFVFSAIENCLPFYDLIYVHLKEPDKYAHDGNFEGKIKAIEEIDKKFEKLKDYKGNLVITCDHITSTLHKKHMPGKVPLLIFGKGKDKVKKFDEFSAKKGSLKNFTPKKLWKFIWSEK